MLRIGNITGNFNANATDKERLVLSTATQSNMIVLNTEDPNGLINIVLNDSMTIGRSNQYINFTSNNANLMTISSEATIYNAPTYFNNQVIINSNINISIANIAIDGTGINAPNVISCNVSILYPSDAFSYFTIQEDSPDITTPTLQVSQNILTYMGGNIGIGTISPSEQFHMTSNALIEGNLTVAAISTEQISYDYDNFNSNLINLNGNFLDNLGCNVNGIVFANTNVSVEGVLRAPNFALKNINVLTAIVTSNANFANTYIHNYTCNNNIPTLVIDHNTSFTRCNVIDVNVNTNSIMSLNNAGCISFGKNNASNARATLDINYTNSNNVSNMVIVSGVSPTNVFTIDNNANIGIGTSIALHPLHITRLNEDITNNAFIGIYDNTLPDPSCNIGYGPLLMACNIASNIQITYLDKYGALTLGNIPYDPAWTLNVANSLNVPFIQTNAIYPNTNVSENIDFGNASLTNVFSMSLSNVDIAQLTTTSNLTTEFFSACNFLIRGLNIFNNDNDNYFQINNSNYIFTGDNACFSTNPLDLQTSPTTDGKLKIVVQDVTNVNTPSVGINVVGNRSTAIRVSSTVYGDAVYESYGINNYRSYSGIGTDSVYFISYGTNDSDYYNNRAFQISGNGIRLAKNVQITNSGLSINNGGNNLNPTSFTQKLLVRGVTQINDVQNNPVLFVNDGSAYDNTNIGIGTVVPNAKLHVIGNAIITDNAYLMCNAIISCNVGIGTTNPNSTLDVYGTGSFTSSLSVGTDLNIGTDLTVGNTVSVNNKLLVASDIYCTGNIYQGSLIGSTGPPSVNVSSQWATSNFAGNVTVSSTGSNIGIGISTPTNQLHVFGGSTFSITKNSGSLPTSTPTLSVTGSTSNFIGTSANINYTLSSSSLSNLVNLFDQNVIIGNTTTSWSVTGYTGANFTFNNSGNNTSFITNTAQGPIVGHHISVALNTSVNLTSISLNCDNAKYGPAEVVLTGSLDNSTWIYIGTYTFSTWTSASIPNIINVNTYGIYQYYRIVFTRAIINNLIKLQEVKFNYGINRNIYIDNGAIGIGTTQPRQGLDLTDVNIIINSSSSNSSSNINVGLGIGTNVPQYPLHVVGKSYFQNGNVGIGKSQTAFTLDVGGNINFDGALFQSGYQYISSQWTSGVNGGNLTFYSTGCNIGIGTTTPSCLLDVYGDAFFRGGNVGIGKSQTAFTLDVGGNINFDGALYQSGYQYISSHWTSGINAGNITFYSTGSNIGIGTTTPSHILDVYGDVYFQNGNVGIGKTQSSFTLDVGGNINFDGSLFQSGYKYISSQWVSGVNGSSNTVYNIGSNVGIGTNLPGAAYALHVNGKSYFANGNVGIATTTANYTLHVGGDVNFTGSLYQNGFKQTNSQWFSVGSNSFSNIYSISNVGIGTTNPQFPLHVLGRSYLVSNVGIATPVSTNYTLDVGGNVNFSGFLTQSGSRYISSQWTSVASNSFSNIYSQSNVGIGTTNPLFPLHVVGNVFLGSNLNVKGMITATKNIATTSDLRVKTDLKKIENPLDIINELNGYKYRRTDIGSYEYGLIAQEVQRVMPELVGSHNNLLNISYGNMSAVFVEAIKKLNYKIELLENEVKLLKGVISPMEL